MQEKQGHSTTTRQTIIINSKDRFSYDSTGVGDFQIALIPRDGTVKSMRLKYASLPFAFKNVTNAYGNTLVMRVYPDGGLPAHWVFTFIIPTGYYTIQSLIVEMNIQMASQLSFHLASFSVQFITSPQNGVIAIQSTNTLLKLEVIPSVVDSGKRYIYTMLGFSNRSNTILQWAFGISYLNLPFFATQELPFSSILINMDLYPDKIFTTSNNSALFVIPVHGYNAIETLLAGQQHDMKHGIQWNENDKFDQYVHFDRSLSNLQTIRIRLYDDKGNPLTEHFQENDYVLFIDIEKVKLV
jgi:hypothetical protein